MKLPYGPLIPYEALGRRRKKKLHHRARQLEKANKRRQANDYPDVDYEPVDIVQICKDEDWRCCICGQPINLLSLHPAPDSLSYEHKIAMSNGGGHTPKNSAPAHLACNLEKAKTHDSPRAAKLKRMAGETGQQARRKRNGSTFWKPADYVSPLNSKSKFYRKRGFG